jgi:hypothetical protein
MAMNSAKRKEMVLALKGSEPSLSSETYGSDFLKALNYYNFENDDKDKKKWLIAYVAKQDKKLAVTLTKVDEQHFRHAGILARLVHNGSMLMEKEELYLANKIVELTARAINPVQKVVKETETPKNVIPLPSIQERMEEKARELAGEIEGAIDDFVLGGCKSTFSTKNYLAGNQVAGPIAKRIGEMFVRTAEELREAIEGNDEQLVEGYSHFTKKELKKFAEFVESIVADCNQMVQTAKANRAPRQRKEKPASVQVAKMKYLKEFTELSLKSVNPASIIGSTEVWYYNTKYKHLGVYKGENGNTLSVKGTTIIGFDIKESKRMTLRKPEDFFKGLSLGKRALNTAIKTLRTKPAVPNGRFNEETILLGAF